MMLIKNIGKSVKFIGSKHIQESRINMSLQLYISYLNKHIVTLHNVSLRLLRSVNTLNSKVKFKTILINKSQLLLKVCTLKRPERSQGLQQNTARQLNSSAVLISFTQLYVAYSKLCRGKLLNRKSKPYAISEKRHKDKKFAIDQNVIVRNSPVPSWVATILFLLKTVESLVFDVMRMISTQIRWRDRC